MLQSMRSRENGGTGVTDKCELYMLDDGTSLDHHWSSGPEARDHTALLLRSLTGGHFPAAPAGGARGGAGGP